MWQYEKRIRIWKYSSDIWILLEILDPKLAKFFFSVLVPVGFVDFEGQCLIYETGALSSHLPEFSSSNMELKAAGFRKNKEKETDISRDWSASPVEIKRSSCFLISQRACGLNDLFKLLSVVLDTWRQLSKRCTQLVLRASPRPGWALKISQLKVCLWGAW